MKISGKFRLGMGASPAFLVEEVSKKVSILIIDLPRTLGNGHVYREYVEEISSPLACSYILYRQSNSLSQLFHHYRAVSRNN